MLSFDSAKLLLFSYSYNMLNETEMKIAIRLLTLALNNNNNIYNYENYIDQDFKRDDKVLTLKDSKVATRMKVRINYGDSHMVF